LHACERGRKKDTEGGILQLRVYSREEREILNMGEKKRTGIRGKKVRIGHRMPPSAQEWPDKRRRRIQRRLGGKDILDLEDWTEGRQRGKGNSSN